MRHGYGIPANRLKLSLIIYSTCSVDHLFFIIKAKDVIFFFIIKCSTRIIIILFFIHFIFSILSWSRLQWIWNLSWKHRTQATQIYILEQPSHLLACCQVMGRNWWTWKKPMLHEMKIRLSSYNLSSGLLRSGEAPPCHQSVLLQGMKWHDITR